MAGVPASGLLTGQDCCKTQEEVDLFGGFLGNYEGNVPSFDGGCVDNPFRWCDNLSNNDPTVLTFMSQGVRRHDGPHGVLQLRVRRYGQRRQSGHRPQGGGPVQGGPAQGTTKGAPHALGR